VIRTINQLIQKYDAASVFVLAATIVVIVELSLMRILVPSSAAASTNDSGVLMEQVYDDTSVATTSEQLAAWNNESLVFINRLQTRPDSWQKELETSFAFGFEQMHQQPNNETSDEVKRNVAADYAAKNLYLQSVMTGSRPLANISGKMYRVGDEVSVRGGEIMMIVLSIQSDYVTVHLDEHPEVTRTIYVSSDMQLVTGERLP
jgi:hypothetical protein